MTTVQTRRTESGYRDPQRWSGRIDWEMPARLTPAQPIPDASGKEVIRPAAIMEAPPPLGESTSKSSSTR